MVSYCLWVMPPHPHPLPSDLNWRQRTMILAPNGELVTFDSVPHTNSSKNYVPAHKHTASSRDAEHGPPSSHLYSFSSVTNTSLSNRSEMSLTTHVTVWRPNWIMPPKKRPAPHIFCADDAVAKNTRAGWVSLRNEGEHRSTRT